MNRITAILEVHADGTLHVPMPENLRHGQVKIDATVHAANAESSVVEAERLPRATPEMLRRRRAALDALRASGGLRDVIPDPVAWQREMREDRPLPGRD